MQNKEIFICNLIQINRLMRGRDKALEMWGDDIPSTVLFSYLGKDIIENFDAFSEEQKIYIFNIIEKGMSSNNEELVASVATGLLEAAYSKSKQINFSWKKIELFLGEKSKKYLLDWLNTP